MGGLKDDYSTLPLAFGQVQYENHDLKLNKHIHSKFHSNLPLCHIYSLDSQNLPDMHSLVLEQVLSTHVHFSISWQTAL